MDRFNLSKLSHTVLIFILFCIIFASCKNNKESFIRNPEKQIVRELQQRKIVMLADFAHSSPLPYQSVISVLEQWLSEIENDGKVFRHLSLILESDDQIVNIIKEFVKSGDLNPVLYFWLPFGSLEDLEFYIDLRQIYSKIESINSGIPSNQNISLDIFGGEPGNVFNYPGMLGASKEESLNFFKDIRDSLIADRITNYLETNPNNKALIFYGSSHLNKNYSNKDFWNFYPDDKKYGYFLAHYLKRYFGDNQVLSVNQKIFPDAYENSPIEYIRKEEVFSYSDNIKWPVLKPENYDAFIIKTGNFIPAHSNNLIFSSRVIESCIHKMKELKPYLPGFYAQRYYDISLKSLQFISGKNYISISDWEQWYKNEYFLGFQKLDSEEFSKQIAELYFSNINDTKMRLKLFSLGFGPGIMLNNSNLPTKDIWLETIWPKVLPTIKFFNSVGFLLIGNPYEKKIGKEHLLEYTKNDFKNPDKYLKWWRKNFGNVGNEYFY